MHDSDLPEIVELPVTATSRPFLAETSLPDGYTEREFTMSGVASYYDLVSPETWELSLRKSAGYRTRLLVRTPRPDDFNGVVVVEFLNVTLECDLDAEWMTQAAALAGDGAAYVGVTVQRLGTENLARWDPARYEGMHIWDDGMSYRLFSHAGRVVRERPDLVLGGLSPTTVVATGSSQSAWRLVTYINAFHLHDQVYDGFLLRGRGPGATPLRGDGVLNGPSRAPIRADIDVPVLIVQTEGDLVSLRSVYDPQDDGGNLRIWEIPGSSHGTTESSQHMDARIRSMGIKVPTGILSDEQPNCMRTNAVGSHAYRALRRWVVDGEPPHPAPRIERSREPGKPGPVWGRIDPSIIARDAHGNAKGGIRLPDIEVPLARWVAATDGNRLLGSVEPFPLEKVRALYPTHEAYVDEIRAACRSLVEDGFMTAADGAAFVEEAEESPVPDRLPAWLHAG